MLDYWTTGERDYDEEEWQRREYETEGLAELEHERNCDGTCDYCVAVMAQHLFRALTSHDH